MVEFLSRLLDPTGFVPRRSCGDWTPELIGLHNVSDMVIWLSYMAIPGVLIFFVRRRRDVPVPWIFWLFGLFIVSCGLTHLLDVMLFYVPLYRLAGLAKLITAVVSAATVFALVPTVRLALAFRSPAELEREVALRTAELAAANSKLREQQDHLSVILASIADGVIATNQHGDVTFFNPAAQRLTGWQADVALGRPLQQVFRIVEETSLQAVESPVAAVLRDGREVGLSNHACVVAQQGQRLPIESLASPIRDHGGNLSGVVLIFRDVAERRRTMDLGVRLAAVVDTAGDAIITVSEQGRIESFNRAAERIFGYGESEAVGENVQMLVTQERGGAEAAVVLAPAGGKTSREVVGKRRDGAAFPMELSVAEFRLGDGSHFACWARDLTDQKKLEEQYRQAQKMEAVGQLAGGIAHDFNNLLTVILGYTKLLQDRKATDEFGAAFLREIAQAGERAAALTCQLLAFSRRQVVAPQVLDLNAIVGDLEKMLRRLIGEHIVLSVELAADLGHIRVDRGQIEQVLMNLAINARDAMPRGGQLTIATANDLIPEGHAALSAGPHVLLSVADNGCGMTPEVQARAFEPFFTTKSVGKGTGLGLATVYGII